MKYLVCGAGGFIGRSIVARLDASRHDVFCIDKIPLSRKNTFIIDINKEDAVADIVSKIHPDYIFQCAGVVEKTEKAVLVNPRMTLNVLQALMRSGASEYIKKIVILGSAAEYGILPDADIAVSEDVPLLGDDYYAHSKILETSLAFFLKKQYGLPIVVGRIFTPIGPEQLSRGSPGRLLIPNIFRQIQEVRVNKRSVIDAVARFEPARDYIDIRDVAEALVMLGESTEQMYSIYNIGTGVATSNKEILDALLDVASLDRDVTVIQSQKNPEPIRAGKADITRITNEYGWKPRYSLSESLHALLYGY